MKSIYVVGTADTKGEELAYLARIVREGGGRPLVVDVGTRRPAISVDIAAETVAAFHPQGASAVLGTDDRGTAVAAMTEAFTRFIESREDMAGIVGIGGGGGTAIVTAGMRTLPIGLPKLMVSTLAAGDVSAYVDVSDIGMMPSVTDLAGLNRLSRVILHNAGRAIAAMAASPPAAGDDKPAIGLTMFGVTTPCVTAVARALKPRYDGMVFHATGTGGRAMEKLAASGMLAGLIDITTTEICDLLVGGVLAARETRLDVVAETRLPYVGSVGALDMVNFREPETVPEHFAGRLFYRHNPHVTLMRTTAEECRRIGAWIAAKLDRCEGSLRFLIPERGVSALDREGEPFFDPQADEALFSAIEAGLRPRPNRRVERLPFHINDPEFAQAIVVAWNEIAV